MFKHADKQNTNLALNKKPSSLRYGTRHHIHELAYKLLKMVRFWPTLYIRWSVPQITYTLFTLNTKN